MFGRGSEEIMLGIYEAPVQVQASTSTGWNRLAQGGDIIGASIEQPFREEKPFTLLNAYASMQKVSVMYDDE